MSEITISKTYKEYGTNIEKRIEELEFQVETITKEMDCSKFNFEQLSSLHMEKQKTIILKDSLIDEWFELCES
jgi:chaperonin cofactor prefoldin